jgi:putative ABC transport system permease protein
MLKILIYNFRIASDAILHNKLRAVLTSLGIICGVASVIAMLAIGKGAEQEILEKMRLLGTNNIIIKPIDKRSKENKSENTDQSTDTKDEDTKTNDEEKQKKRFSPGLSLKDAEGIAQIIPDIAGVSSECITDVMASHNGFKRNVKLIGTNIEYFSINQFNTSEGNFFHELNIRNSEPVCVIGFGIKTKLFPSEDPIGKPIKCGNNWMKIIGVIAEKKISRDNVKNLGIRDYNFDIYIPITTMLLRYTNRSLITKKDLAYGNRSGVIIIGGTGQKKDNNLNQIDRIIVSVKNTDDMSQTAEIINRMLKRKHNQVEDYEIVVPELLLEQEQHTKRIFNIVLGAIASISLLVGGIGIMNIMLASVLERTREIGIRKAVGAKQRDILLQFLSEAVSISLSGGIIGIFTGLILSLIIEKATGINTISSFGAIALAFLVSISVGLIFGITPARRASKQDPIELLRYE